MFNAFKRTILSFFLLASLSFLLDSCWAINEGRGWNYPSNQHPFEDLNKYKETDIGFEINVHRRQLGFPIPLFFIFYFDISRKYFIRINFSTHNTHYNRIDSVKYGVFDTKDSLLFKGVIKGGAKGVFKDYISEAQREWHGYPRFLTAKVKMGHLDLNRFKDLKNLKMNIAIYGIADSSKCFSKTIDSIPISNIKGVYYDAAD